MSGSEPERCDDASDRSEELLNRVIGDYLHALESGEDPDRDAIVQRYPELAPDLKAFFENEDRFERVRADVTSVQRQIHPVSDGDVFGDYEIIEEIGRGGMGVVYRARQRSLNRLVALKLIIGGNLVDPSRLRRFRIEAEACASLAHPHIVSVYEFGEENGCGFLSMQLIEGESLATLSGQTRASAREAARLVVSLARAIQHAHERGILHRDLKPANVLISSDGEPHVTDFGLARFLEEDSTLTRSGALVGTPGYMAPEQASGGVKGLTIAADVYGLGAILYELLSGRPPFTGKSSIETLHRVVNEDPPTLRSLGVDVSRDLETICLKCLQKDPRRRYESARALADDLERYLRGETVLARPTTALDFCLKLASRHPAGTALVAVTVLAVVSLLVVSLFYNRWLEEMITREKEGRARADALAAVSRRILYGDRLTRAYEDWGRGRWKRARSLLRGYIPSNNEDLRGFGWRHLLRRLQIPRVPFTGFATINKVVFSPNGTLVATADTERRVILWRTDSGERVATLHGHSAQVLDVAFSHDGELIASCQDGEDPDVIVFDAETHREKRRFDGHTGNVHAVAFSPDGEWLASAGRDGTVRFWNLQTEEESRRLKADSSVLAIAYSPGGEQFVTGDEGTGLRVWSTHELKLIKKLDIAPFVSAVAFSPDRKKLAAANALGEITIWSRPAYEQEATVQGHSATVEDLAFSPDSATLVSCSWDAMVRLWGAADLEAHVTCFAHSDSVNSVAFSPDGLLLATASNDGKTKLWDTRLLREPELVAGHEKAIWDLGVLPDGRGFVTGDDDYRYVLWELRNDAQGAHTVQRQVFDPPGRDDWIYGSLAPDGRRIVCAEEGDVVEVLRIDTGGAEGRVVREARLPAPGRATGAEFSSESRLLAVVFDALVICWERIGAGAESRWEEVARFTAGERELKTLSFSSDGALLALGSRGSQHVEVWRVKTEEQHSAIQSDVAVTDLCFSPDSKRLAAGCADGMVFVWRQAEGAAEFEEWIRLRGHDASVEGMVFFPDSDQLVTAGDDRTVRLWDLVSTIEGDMGTERATLRGAREPIKIIAFAAAGDVLVTAGGDSVGEVRVWRTASPREIARSTGPAAE